MGACCDKAGNPVQEVTPEIAPVEIAATPPAVAETSYKPPEPPKTEAAPTDETAKLKEALLQPAAEPVVIEFDAEGVTKSVSITEVPLGISFKNTMPLTAAKVVGSSAAAKAGVQEKFVLKSVGGKSLDGLDYNAAITVLKTALAPLPKAAGNETYNPGAFVVEFSTPVGAKQVNFTRKPLGMSFDSKMPMVITNITPGTEAEKEGVQIGWEIVKMGETDVAGRTYQSAFKLMQAGLKLVD